MRIFQSLIDEPDLEWEFIDASIVKAHQHSAGATGKEDQGIGDSRGGKTTKIHMAVDAFGLPILFTITGGEVHDCKAAPVLIDMLPKGEYIIADKGTIVRPYVNKLMKSSQLRSFQGKRIQRLVMIIWIGVCTSIGI